VVAQPVAEARLVVQVHVVAQPRVVVVQPAVVGVAARPVAEAQLVVQVQLQALVQALVQVRIQALILEEAPPEWAGLSLRSPPLPPAGPKLPTHPIDRPHARPIQQERERSSVSRALLPARVKQPVHRVETGQRERKILVLAARMAQAPHAQALRAQAAQE
jgi:hypothetical protein